MGIPRPARKCQWAKKEWIIRQVIEKESTYPKRKKEAQVSKLKPQKDQKSVIEGMPNRLCLLRISSHAIFFHIDKL